jgi:hypothetical protein
MATPCIPNPYAALASYALGGPSVGASQEEIQEAEKFALSLQGKDPPLLEKFLALYPPQSPMRKTTVERSEEAEGLLMCIWRGDLKGVLNPKAGPYTHFKGETYLCYGEAKLLQGPKEEVAVVYSNKKGDTFVRPLREWVEIVKWPDGRYRPRFVKERA